MTTVKLTPTKRKSEEKNAATKPAPPNPISSEIVLKGLK